MKKLMSLIYLAMAFVSLSALAADAESTPVLWPAYDPNTGLWGYIDEQGAWGIEPQWERAYHFHDGCAIVDTVDIPSWEGKSTQGIIDETGAYLLEPMYSIDDACCLDGAGALYLVNQYDDERGSGWFNIPNRYFSGLHWTECYAWQETPYILVNDEYAVSGLADRAMGELVLPMEYSYTGLYDWAIEDGYIVAQRDEGGSELIQLGVGPVALPEDVVIDYGEGVSDGMVPFEQDGLYGYLNTAGEIVIPAQYDYAYAFRDGYAEVNLLEEAETHAIIDRQGQVVLMVVGSGWSYSYNGMVAGALFVQWPDDTWGLVEPDGAIRCRHTLPEGAYDAWVYEFTPDGPLWVEYSMGDDEYLWGMMSREGELLGEPRWTWVSRWQEEPWVIVCENGAWGFADAYGRIVLPVQYEEAERFWGALAWVKFDASTQGYISRDGTVVYAWSNEE